ncbi:helix-turn-helix domain-containing protein [Mycolicibacterium gilvum]|uniref:helix-turn-helix domain-containing protein n=1 Tax=Mycolicibacterium gilvum TaxID=1804 RepID=UPI0040468711
MTAAVSHKRNPDYQALIQERCERVAAMTRAGYTASQIAVILRITERTVQRYRVRTGCSQPAPLPLTPEEITRAEELLEDGCSLSEVARTIGRSHDAVVRRFQGRGWTRQQRAEFLHMVRRMREIA